MSDPLDAVDAVAESDGDSLPRVLLTNAAGIEAAGLRVVHEAFDRVADVTVVAPAEAVDGAGRGNTRGFGASTHETGYAVDGTPVDCIHFARTVLEGSFDAVVSGCAHGPTMGAHNVGRSGTVGAAIEAAHLGIPAVALSLYDPDVGRREFEGEDFETAGRVARTLLEPVVEGLPDGADYLNVNVPTVPGRLRVTEPVHDFALEIERHADGYHARDRFYDPLADGTDVPMTDDVGTDRRAAAEGEVSVTPLSVREGSPSLAAVREALDGRSLEE